MKRKILIFLAALLCITAFLASCGDSDCLGHVDDDGDNKCDECSATIKVCDAHVDDNDDAKCDVCKRAVVKVKVPAGTTSDLVVKPLPEGGKLTDYLITEFESGTYVLAAGKELPVDGQVIKMWASIIDDCAHVDVENEWGSPVKDNNCDKCGDLMAFTNSERLVLLIKSTAVEGEDAEAVTTTTYTVYDAFAEKALYTYSYDDADENTVTDIDISLDGYGFIVDKKVSVTTPAEIPEDEATVVVTTTYDYFTYADEEAFYHYETTEQPEIDSREPEEAENGIWYVELDGTVYAIDNLTGKLLHKASKDVFVKRPVFDKVVGGYGVVELMGSGMMGETVTGLYVYDLSKWLSCVYTYEIPADAINTVSFYLDNGNLLVQYMTYLGADAKNYDLDLGDTKADLTYVYVDIEKQTATEVEFGYFIVSCQNGEGVDVLYKDNVQNVINVWPIIDGTTDVKNQMTLIVDNDLTIKFACNTYSIPAQSGPLFVVDDNRYITSFKYGADGNETWAVVDENLEIVCYLPDAYAEFDEDTGRYVLLNPEIYRDGFIVKGNKIFNFDMELIIDLEEEKYNVYQDCVNFFILTKTFVTEDDPETLENEYESVTKTYFFDPAENEAPVEVTGEIVAIDEMMQYLVIENVVAGEEDEPDTYTYDVIDANGNTLIADLEESPHIDRSTGLSYLTVFAGDKYYMITTSILGK